MSVAKYKILLEKSISATISAIEVYNKPDFKYREESFIILLVNAYEVMLKAKVVKESKNGINSLYFKEYKLNKKGQKTKQKVLATKIKMKNPLIKKNKTYYNIRNKFLENSDLCYKRYPDPRTNKGNPKKFYNLNLVDLILNDFNNLQKEKSKL
jgi:hypothetical protein